MTKDDIITLVEQAGWDVNGNDESEYEPLWAFAKLVAAAEREQCAKVCEQDDSMRWSGAADAIRQRSQS